MPGGARFDVFISYSRSADEAIAVALEAALERFAKPWYRMRALRVFRDDGVLAAGSGLWSELRTALDGAGWFLLLASPAAVRSDYVAREVEHWLAHRPRGRLLIAVTEGEIAWDQRRGEFDWEQTTALPRALEGAFGEEPRYVDLRFARDGTDLSLSDRRFRFAVADLAAPPHGSDKEAMIGEEFRQHRRTMRLARGAVAGLTLLAVAATVAAVLAVRAARTARSEQQAALSRGLIAEARATGRRDPELSALLTLEAWRFKPTLEARSATLASLATLERLRATAHVQERPLEDVAISADGTLLASAGSDGSVRLADARTGRVLGPLRPGHRGQATSVAFSPDGELLVSGGEDGTLRIWDTATRRLRRRPVRGSQQLVWDVAFHPRGRIVASAGDDTIRLLDVTTGRRLGTPMRGHRGTVGAVAFSPDGKRLASGGDDGDVRLWRTATRQGIGRPLQDHTSPVGSVAFGGDPTLLASGSDDGTVRLWDTSATPPRGRRIAGPGAGAVLAVALSADGTTLAYARGDLIGLWDVKHRRPVPQPLQGHSDTVWGLAFAEGSPELASASEDGTLRVWDARPRRRFSRAVPELPDELTQVMFVPGGARLATVGADGTVRTWSASTLRPAGRPVKLAGGGEISLGFGPGGSIVATRHGMDGRANLWYLPAAADRGVGGTPYFPLAVALSPDGRTLATADLDTIRLWDARTRQPLGRLLRLPDEFVVELQFSPDGSLLASGGDDGTLRLFDVRARRRLGRPVAAHLTGIRALAFSPGGRLVASGGEDRRVRLWEARTRRPVGRALTGHGDFVSSLAFSPRGALLASGDTGGALRLWDVASGRALGGPLRGDRGSVDGVAFDPRGRFVTTAGPAGVRLWDRIWWSGSRPTIERELCRRVGRSLTPAEWAGFAPEEPYRSTCVQTD